MIYLFTVASPPRSGTKWYAELFTVDHSYCYHELTGVLHPYPSNLALLDRLKSEIGDHDFEQKQRRLLLQAFPQYFERLWERTYSGQYVIGNSDAGTNALLPALWLVWPDMKFLFSFRNGINQVNSRLIWESHVPAMVRASEQKRHQTADYFEQCCRSWAAAIEGLKRRLDWLSERGAACVETRLEQVTTDVNELKRVWNWVVGDWNEYEERNRALMTSPVNPRVNLKKAVSWEQIWDSWMPEQQRVFSQLCGATQRSLGYELPTG